MEFFKKLDNKIKSFLEKQIEKQDKIILEKKNKPIITKEKGFQYSTNLKLNPNKSIDVSLYFFDLHDLIAKKNIKNSIDNNLMDYYFVLGLATQGRIDEMNELIEKFKDNEQERLYSFFLKNMPKLMKMAKIAEKVENSDIGSDLKDNETIGQYYSRKLLKRKTFMNEFEFFKNFEINKFLTL